ncbi:het-domain-containing protein [Diplodia corticola]|uniref:Het-domain-containing protein n=1 Tax=Diplodia corticola TaxID=236234 RepID=A0A1J9R4T4_9PEZI|nr:het-domain-containing protein [Diplodia corticola]OJD35242.1 het-domain-containing protein [Diplodia corticola]
MELYLARVRERDDKSLYVERKQALITAESYVAISHVWGDPSTINTVHIDGVGPVKLSPGKKDLLHILRRPDICGAGWFWLDLFCIDQSPSSPIPISAQLMAIPAIYRSSSVVVILIESPVCSSWIEQATDVAEQSVLDTDVFGIEEAAHARKCPNLVLMDPWFDRLWTRQEGLYAMKLRMIILNEVACARFSTAPAAPHDGDRWLSEQQAVAKRDEVATFIADKLAYHGIPDDGGIASECFYFDLMYKHRVDVTNYSGHAGPAASSYMPIRDAWKSNRRTSKARDYVLAVFPDIDGYRVPLNVRNLSFHQLLEDACEQVRIKSGRGRGSAGILPKIPRSMMTTMASDSDKPWIPESPASISEAYDSIVHVGSSTRPAEERSTAEVSTSGVDAQPSRLRKAVVLRLLEIHDLAALEDLVEVSESGVDLVRHVVLSAPSGPFVGSGRALQSEKDLLHRFFAHRFAEPALRQYAARGSSGGSPAVLQRLRSHGVVDSKSLDYTEQVFEQEAKKFLACLMCGTTIACATAVLKHLDLAMAVAEGPCGEEKMLALVSRTVLAAADRYELALEGGGFEDFRGLQLLSTAGSPETASIVVGRTMIPKKPC